MVTVEEVLQRLPWAARRHRLPSPDEMALLVIDMQEYFRDLAGPLISCMVPVVETCQQVGVPVIFTRHTQKAGGGDAGMLGEWWSQLIYDGTPEAEILEELQPYVDEQGLVRKTRYDAFWNTNLAARLEALRVRELVISGVMTHLCCETTARAAFVRDYRVFFLIDGTATDDVEHHWASLRNLIDGFTYWLSCRELQDHVGERGKGLLSKRRR